MSRLLLFCTGVSLAVGLAFLAEVGGRLALAFHCLTDANLSRRDDCSVVIGAVCSEKVGAQPLLYLGLAGALAVARELARRRLPP